MSSHSALVLAAGSSRRLGQPKQLLPYRDTTLLGATLDTVRSCGFDQIVLTLGNAAVEVMRMVDLSGVTVVHNPSYEQGCSSSISAALTAIAEDAPGFVLLLGDQPHIAPQTVSQLLERAAPDVLTVTRYQDGLGHPFWLGRDLFEALSQLHGDKGVWKLIDAAPNLGYVEVASAIPQDVDTWADYDQLQERG
jgi:molybdenum cofactor cytidylyltransferase